MFLVLRRHDYFLMGLFLSATEEAGRLSRLPHPTAALARLLPGASCELLRVDFDQRCAIASSPVVFEQMNNSQ